MNRLVYCLLFFLLCSGCYDAAQDRRAEQIRQDDTVKDLKNLGESMHNAEPAGDAAAGADQSGQ